MNSMPEEPTAICSRVVADYVKDLSFTHSHNWYEEQSCYGSHVTKQIHRIHPLRAVSQEQALFTKSTWHT